MEMVAGQAACKEVEMVLTPGDGLPERVCGDAARLGQVLVNLLTNAVKFTERGELEISVSGQAIEASRLRLRFAVRDTGVGIPADRMGRLFRSFSQVDGSSTRRHGGTGLGLAISRRLCELMDGSMTVESQVGRGSTFSFVVEVGVEPDSPVPAWSGSLQGLAGKCLLVVERHDLVRDAVLRHARGWGLRAVGVASESEALAMVEGGRPVDIVTLDVRLADIPAGRLIRRLSEPGRPGRIPVVLVAPLGQEVPSGVAAELVTRPLLPGRLRQALERAAAGPGRTRPAEPQREETLKMGERHPMHILLVEDNAVNQLVARQLLSQLGYRADVSGNGREAIEALEEHLYDVVLMDVQMPEMDGLEATRWIRQRWRARDGPYIIAMTANAMLGDREMCLDAGMDDYVSKPMRVHDLADVLGRAAERGVAGLRMPL